MAEITLTNENFDTEVMSAELPVIVDFWSERCAPCRMLSPVIEEIANEYGGQLKVGKVNVDDCPSLAERYGIKSIPTVLAIKDGKVVGTSVGYRSKGQILGMI